MSIPVAKYSLPSEPGNERAAMNLVAAAVSHLNVSPAWLARLKTAVAEATMNAMEHGNRYQSDVPVTVCVLATAEELLVRITDQGGGSIPGPDAAEPDLAAKLDGHQSARGWGLLLIRNMVDRLTITAEAGHHTVELAMRLKGDVNGDETA